MRSVSSSYRGEAGLNSLDRRNIAGWNDPQTRNHDGFCSRGAEAASSLRLV